MHDGVVHFVDAELTNSPRHQRTLTTSMMLSLFHSLNRPLALSWYTATKFHVYLTNLTMWQIEPSKAAYAEIHPRYRPSALQLTETHPIIIDWCPFPTLRDKLIMQHAANPFVDRIVCDIATAYVIETDVSIIVDLGEPTLGYIRVLDLINALQSTPLNSNYPGHEVAASSLSGMAGAQESEYSLPDNEDTTCLPAKSSHDLFENKTLARLAFEKLGIESGLARYKLDPALFAKYPELYDVDADVLASGICISPRDQIALPTAEQVLDSTILRAYNDFADWSMSAISMFQTQIR